MAFLEDPAPLLDCQVSLFSSGREDLSLPTCEQKRLTHHFWRLDIPLEMFCKTEDPFTLFPHCISFSSLPFDFSSSLLLSLWSTKQPGIQTPIRWLFWGTSLPSSWSAVPPIKVLLASTTPWRSDSLAYGEASRPNLDSVTAAAFYILSSSSQGFNFNKSSPMQVAFWIILFLSLFW